MAASSGDATRSTTKQNGEGLPGMGKFLASFVSTAAIMGLAVLIVSRMGDCGDPAGFGCLGVLFYALIGAAALSVVVNCFICYCSCENDRDEDEGLTEV